MGADCEQRGGGVLDLDAGFEGWEVLRRSAAHPRTHRADCINQRWCSHALTDASTAVRKCVLQGLVIKPSIDLDLDSPLNVSLLTKRCVMTQKFDENQFEMFRFFPISQSFEWFSGTGESIVE